MRLSGDEDVEEKFKRAVRETARRLQPVCSQFPRDDFEALVCRAAFAAIKRQVSADEFEALVAKFAGANCAGLAREALDSPFRETPPSSPLPDTMS